MKLQRTTWILAGLALALGSAVYFGDIRGRQWREAAQTRQQQIVRVAADEIAAIAIERDDDAFIFERNAAADPSTGTPAWEMVEPLQGPASDPALSFLVNQLVDGQQQQVFRINRSEREEYGLAEPTATLTVTVADRAAPHQILLGRPNFEDKLVYALIDPDSAADAGQLEVALVPIELQYAVERELNEWLSSPEDSDSDADPALETPEER